MKNTLYYGDNLSVLREQIPDDSVDLLYLDPPFNSNATYNVLFRERTGEESPAQIQAFTDTWRWTQETEATLAHEIIANPGMPAKVVAMVTGFLEFIGRNDMLAYLVMMAPRLVELQRVLKSTGSIYLHCDPTASHYLKLLMDSVFGIRGYRNEITWRRTSAHSDANRYGANTDTILFYTNGNQWTFNPQYQEYDDKYRARFRFSDPDGRLWADDNLTAKGLTGGGYTYEYKGVTSLWRVPPETMQQLDAEGRLHFTRRGGIRRKRYLDESRGRIAQALWDDIQPINSQSRERLGYPTQKPEALLERVIRTSSNEGDVVLDPFCGCGTAVAAAQKLSRQWIGIDITHLAVAHMKSRIKTAFNLETGEDYDVIGEPTDVGGARALWEEDPYQFQFWAVSLLDARPQEKQRRGPDSGIDGLLYFIDGPRSTPQKIVIQVKGGQVSVPHIRDLKGVVEREQAVMGLFISLEPPTGPMRTEAVSGGFYHSDLWGRDFPKLQMRTIAQLLEGQGFELPPSVAPAYQAAQRVRRAQGRQASLGEAGE